MTSGDNTERMLDDIYPSSKPRHAELRKKKFQPWHRPRKQWIRDNQWNRQTRNLIELMDLRDGETLRYLSLPGDELLDVRNLHELCREKEIHLKYLGFNHQSDPANQDSELHISVNEVSRLTNIHQDSRVVRDKFESIAIKNSKASQFFQDYGPYDVVNLDLCNSLSIPSRISKPTRPSYYEALVDLCEFQKSNRKKPWLLFLTSRAGNNDVFVDDIELFWVPVEKNIKSSKPFEDRLREMLSPNFHKYQIRPKLLMALEQNQFLKFFTTGFGKWLLNLMLSGEPKWKVTMLSAYCYPVSSSKKPNMVSLAFLFEPIVIPLRDDSGLVRRPLQDIPNESSLGSAILEQAGSLADLNTIMADAVVFESMLTRSSDLLQSARYSATDYLNWAQKNR